MDGFEEEEKEAGDERERNWAVYLMLLVIGGISAVFLAILLIALTDSVALAVATVGLDLLVVAALVFALERDML